MLQRLWTGFKNIKLSGKISLCLGVSIFLFLVVALSSLEWGFSVYDKKLYEKSLLELNFFSREVDSSIEDLDTMTKRIALDMKMQEELIEASRCGYPSSEYAYHIQNIRNIVQNEMLAYPNVKNISYVGHGAVQTVIGTYTGKIEEAAVKQLLSYYDQAHGAYVFMPPTENYPYLVSGRSILQIQDVTLNNLGALIAVTDINAIVKKYESGLEAEHSVLMIWADDAQIYGSPDYNRYIDFSAFGKGSGYRVLKIGRTRHFVCYMTSKYTNWTYVNIFPFSDVFKSAETVQLAIFCIFFMIAASLVFLADRIAATIVKPLKDLTNSITLLEDGKFQEAKENFRSESRQDEIGQLTKEYGIMLEKIDTLIYENYEKQLVLQDTRYRMLQAQINPHFLYNTLNTLNWTVRAGKNEDAVKMILSLGRLLRATFSKEALITVAEEFRIVQNYILIQQYRYQRRAEFIQEAEGNLDQYLIPNMVLLPLVENALIHGVDQSGTFCTVIVRVKELAYEILLEVRDNGNGMTREELEAVRRLEAKPKGNGIGLKNICERIEMTFGRYSFTVNSSEGAGTDIQIIFPKKEAGGNV